jgi:hypothetical protein
MICGDEPYTGIFPYRSSSYITAFFTNINLPYVHDGTTRKWWVESTLKELNEKSSEDPKELPSKEILTVIQAVIDPVEFASGNSNFDKALDRINTLLKPEALTVKVDEETGKVDIFSVQGLISSNDSELQVITKAIEIFPEVIKTTTIEIENNKIAVIMPFVSKFDNVYHTIYETAKSLDLNCNRSDNIWKNSEIIQDIFELIYSSKIVIADITGKNPNVFYELGIAHTLGRKVIPISQNMADVPFDIQHHRILIYLDNDEGRADLQKLLTSRLKTLKE